MAWLWSAWSILFAAFFLALTSDVAYLIKAAGVLAILQSVSTATIPALLRISGVWASTSTLLIAIVHIAVVPAYVVAVMYWRKAPADTLAYWVPESPRPHCSSPARPQSYSSSSSYQKQ